MTRKWIALSIAGVVSLALVATVYAGGWAIATVKDLPEYAIAGKSFALTFMIRQHGISPLDGLTPAISATLGTQRSDHSVMRTVIETAAVATEKTGEYTASMVLPGPGDWAIQITNAYGSYSLPELKVIAEGTPGPPALSREAAGLRLFVAKGCIGCHANRDVGKDSLTNVGPDLTGMRFPEAYLKSLLANPKAALSGRVPDGTDEGIMPNLDLTQSEIAALTAFINRQRPGN